MSNITNLPNKAFYTLVNPKNSAFNNIERGENNPELIEFFLNNFSMTKRPCGSEKKSQTFKIN